MIQIANLTKVYQTKKGTKVALDIPELVLPDKGMIFVSGKSGSGKSTFINLIGGLDNVTSGDIIVNGVNIAKLNETELTKYRSSVTTYIFQDYYLLPQLNVFENINLLLSDEEKDVSRIDAIIEKTGLKEHIYKKTNELSGGERQRVAIARALAKRPKILLCDEPTGNLDEENSDIVLSLLKELSKEILIVVVSHKRYECETYGDTILHLSNGKVERTSNDFLKDVPTQAKPNCNFVQNKVPAINMAKLFAAFLKNKVASSVFMILMIALLMSLFFVIQSFLSFNASEAIKQSIYDDDQMNLQVIKTSPYVGSVLAALRINMITDEEIDSIGLEKSKVFKLYDISTALIPGENANILDTKRYSNIPLSKNSETTGILCRSTYGLLVCDDEYLLSQFAINGKIEVLAGSLDDCRTSKKVIVTDYLAESLMDYYNYTSIEQCLGYIPLTVQHSSVKHIEIGAIIKTDFKEKYKYLYERYFRQCIVSDNEYGKSEFTALRKDYASRLALTYSLNPNYEDYINDGTLTEKTSLSCFYFEMYDDEGNLVNALLNHPNNYDRLFRTINIKYDLADDEIILYASTYKSLTGIDPPKETHFSDPSYVINVKLTYYKDYNISGTLLYSKDLKVVGVADKYTATSETLRKEIMKYDVIPYAAVLSDFTEVEKVLDFYASNQETCTLNSNSAYSTAKITEIVTTFNDLFKFLGVLLIIILCVLIVAYSLKSITANEYEIGVMKAMGVQGGKLFAIFTVKLMVVVIVGIVLSLLLGLLLVPMSNNVLTKAITGLSTGMDKVPVIIKYTIGQYAIDGLVAIGLSLAVSFVSLLFIKRIKPIKIIKTID